MQASDARVGDFDLSFSYDTSFQNIPRELRSLKQWVGWRFMQKGEGKQSKVPCCAATGAAAGTTEKWAGSWATFEDALEGAERNGLDGVGFVFTPGCGYVGVDIDGAFSTPERAAITKAAVEDLGSYTEISPSGEGLHIILAGELPPGASFCHSGRENSSGFEVYDRGRYFTFTGLLYKGRGTIRSNLPALRRLVQREKGFWPGESAPDERVLVNQPAAPDMPALVAPSTLPDVPEKWLPYFELGTKHDGSDSNVVWIAIAEDLFRAGWTPGQVLTALTQPGPISERLYPSEGFAGRGGSVQGAIRWMWRYIVSRAERNILGAEREVMSLFAAAAADPEISAPSREKGSERGHEAPVAEEAEPAVSSIKLIQPPQVARDYLPPRAWVLPDFIPHGEVVAIYGDGGVGKSFLSLQLLSSIVRGTPFLGKALAVDGPTMAFYSEDDTFEIRRRLRAIGAVEAPTKTGEEFEESLPGLFFQSRRALDSEIATFDSGGKAHRTAFFHELVEAVREHRPSVLILDSTYSYFVGNQNDSAQVRQFITILSEIAEMGTTVILISHPSQSGKNSGEGTSGSVAWSNSVRSRLYLHASDEDPKGVIRLAVMKGNYASSDSDGVIKLTKQAGVFIPWDGQALKPIESEGYVLEIAELIDTAVSMLHRFQMPRGDRRSSDWLVLHTVEDSGRYPGKKKEGGLQRYSDAMAQAFKTGELVRVPYKDSKQNRIAVVPAGMEELVPNRVLSLGPGGEE